VCRLAAIVGAALLLSVGTSAASRSDFRRHTIAGSGVSFALPSTWKALDWKQARRLLGPQFEAIARDNPQVTGFIAQMRQPNSPIKLLAFDPVTFKGFATNANVVITQLSRSLSFDEYAREAIAEVRSLSVSNLRSAKMRLPAGRTLRLTYTLRIKVGGRVITVATTQYAFLRPTRNVVFTYTTLPEAVSLYTPTFTTSAWSIRFSY